MPEEWTQVLDERHVPLLDRKLRPFRGAIEVPAQRVKNHQSAGGSGRRAGPELLDPGVRLACGSRAHQQGGELSDDRVRPGRHGVRLSSERKSFLKPPLLRTN